MYFVDFWGSDPAAENDDCITGQDFDTAQDAFDFYHNPFVGDFAKFKDSTAYISINGNDIDRQKRPNPDYKPAADDDAWKREHAMQQGMMGGIDAYNEAMGFF